MALQKLSPQRLDTSAGIILTPASTPSAPVEGQMYYDSTSDQVQFYNGSAWGSMGGVEGITDNSDAVAMTIDSAEKIGIGITAPDSRLEVKDKIKVSSTSTNPLFDLDNQTTNGKNWRMQAESGDGAFTFKNATDNTTAYQINTSGQFLGLDINGDVTITGDLAISGTTTTTNSTSLLVEDKNIELGKVATPTDTTADGGGITLKGATDKTITWVDADDAWSFNQGIKFTDGTSSLSGSFLQETTTTIEGTISEQKLLMADSATLSGNLTVNDRLVLTQMQDDKYGLDAHVKLLIHSDTTDTSTTFTDSSRLGTHTITANGNAQHKTAQYKFGATSIYVDSGSSYLTIPNHVDFNFGTTDFTIDFWVRADTSGADGGVISKYEIAGWIFDFGTGGSYGQMRFRDQSSGATNMYSTNALNDNQWYHVAVTRSSDVFRLFIDGVQNDSVTTSYDYAGSSMTEPLLIGRYSVANGTGFTGYLDEIRFSGIARWTESFTPPYKAYQDSTPALLTGGYTITGSGTIENGLIDSTDQWEGSTYINTLGTVLTGTLGTGTTFEGTLNSSTTFSGDAGQITAKAWVKYDQDPSTVNDSFNVSSVSDNATGEFTVNFATTMPSANYVTIGMSEDDRFMTIGNNVPPTSSAVKVQTTHYNGNRYDRDHNNVLVFGD